MNRTIQKTGSVSLEAALAIPLIIVLCAFFLGLIVAVTAEIKLKGAMERTAAELSLLGPLAVYVQDAAGLVQDEIETQLPPEAKTAEQLLQSLFPSFSWSGMGSDLLLDAASTALLGDLVLARIAYWLDDAERGHSGSSGRMRVNWRRKISNLRLYLDWQLDRQQLWLCLSWENRHLFGSKTRYLQSVVPLWTGKSGQDNDTGEQGSDDIWLLDNFTRGKSLRQIMGGNLPYDFPVIARFSQGEAVAIKSMDLTAPTYGHEQAVMQQVSGFLGQLAAFQGADYARGDMQVSIPAHSIQTRRLLLVIPGNSDRAWLSECLIRLQEQAYVQGIDLQVIRYGNSWRYREPQAADRPDSQPPGQTP